MGVREVGGGAAVQPRTCDYALCATCDLARGAGLPGKDGRRRFGVMPDAGRVRGNPIEGCIDRLEYCGNESDSIVGVMRPEDRVLG